MGADVAAWTQAAKAEAAVAAKEVYGQTLAAALAITYLGSIPFYYKAGQEYKKIMSKKDGKIIEQI